MTSLIDSLQHALGPGYRIERELGGGGMARVFLATENALHRQVVVKVLAPELAETVSADRFQREIQVAATLQHPHIVPLLTAGSTGPLLYYIMPFVEGETLRGKLARDGALPVTVACQIIAETARALSYAHGRGIIHRDIKPENILLSAGQAQVADFGIAKALAASASDGQLTTHGLVLGTPAYMAPEQATGDGTTDVRGDLYSLGVVAYEMLTGSPPFHGQTSQALMAAHATRLPLPVGDRRRGLPGRLARLVMQLLEKDPGDRPESANEILRCLSSILTLEPETLERPAIHPRKHSWKWRAMAAVGVTALLASVVALFRNHQTPLKLDPTVVAVVPFGVSGDSSLNYLQEGMIDLLAAKLSGTEKLRTVDARTVLRAWRRLGGSSSADPPRSAGVRASRAVGAGRLLEGEVIGSGGHVTLSARLTDLADGHEVRTNVEGRTDSLTSLVDRLAAQLLVLGAAERQDRLAALTTTSLPALRAYLDGRTADRRGDYVSARSLFDRAIELDSGFALAGLGRTMAAVWLGEDTGGPGSLVAWRHRDRLSGRDLILLRFLLGPRYPLFSSIGETLAAAQAVGEAAPDNPEALYVSADFTYHYGPLVGMADPSRRAIVGFERAVALDSSYAPALEHLPFLYMAAGDTLAARSAVSLRLRLDSVTPEAAGFRYFARAFLHDTLMGHISLDDDSLLARPDGVVRAAVQQGVGVSAAESVLALIRAEVSNDTEQRHVEELWGAFYRIRAQPEKARKGMAYPVTPDQRWPVIVSALYGDEDSAYGAGVAAQASRTFTRPDRNTNDQRLREQFAAAQYDLVHGRPTPARDAVRAWRTPGVEQDSVWPVYAAAHFALVLDAQIAAVDGRSDALRRLMELDSVLKDPPDIRIFEEVGNLVAARLWHDRGDDARALACVRHRVIGLSIMPSFATYLRDEGRYAALTGDRAGALRAYQHYLTLRDNPEPSLRAEVQGVRNELAALQPRD
jgi:eukaryotic-like serine/threonine-protein kinase